MFSVVVAGGLVVDGSGAAGVRADVGIENGRIAALGDLKNTAAERVVDARGLVVAPGFVDIHTHSEMSLLVDPRGLSKIRQGVTTEVVGNCGSSPYPATPQLQAQTALADAVDWTWIDLKGYREALARKGTALNVAPLVGHSAIRGAVVGYDDRPPTAAELQAMQSLVVEAMEQGAFGLSVGLTLPPSAYADTDEIVALARAMSCYAGRFYATHWRSWAGKALAGIEESVEVGRRAGVPVQVAHIGISDPAHWGEADQFMSILERGVAQGVDVVCDAYPYTASSSPFTQFTPGWAQSGGRTALAVRLREPETRARMRADMVKGPFGGRPWLWDGIFICQVESQRAKPFEGMSIKQASEKLGLDPLDAALELMEWDDARIKTYYFYRSEEDVRAFLRHPLCMLGSDGSAIAPEGKVRQGVPHPRAYGAHTRLLGRYVREAPVLTLEQAIYKMSGQPADRLHLKDWGRLAVGQAADVVAFDPNTVIDRAEFGNPHQFPVGVRYVLVNGQLAVDEEQFTGALAGQVLEPR